MKSKEELNTLKEEVEMLNKKLAELSEEELKQVTGGVASNSEPTVDILPNIVLPGDGTLDTNHKSFFFSKT